MVLCGKNTKIVTQKYTFPPPEYNTDAGEHQAVSKVPQRARSLWAHAERVDAADTVENFHL